MSRLRELEREAWIFPDDARRIRADAAKFDGI
jgi:hypothetical protein